MSLINDALKRAHDASKNAPANPNVTIRLQPSEEERGHNLFVLAGLPLLIVALMLAGGWFYFYGRPGAPKAASLIKPQPIQTASVPAAAPVAANPAPAPVASAPAVPTVSSPAPVQSEVVSNPAPAPGIVLRPVAAKKTPAVLLPATAPATTAKVAPTFPPLKLQGIYFRRTNPSAMINNQNVGIGETVDGVQVIAIERMLVTVELEGQKKVLTLQ
jgi:cytoskeletal protein RodZ